MRTAYIPPDEHRHLDLGEPEKGALVRCECGVWLYGWFGLPGFPCWLLIDNLEPSERRAARRRIREWKANS